MASGALKKIENARIHPTAIIEEGVRIGDGTAVWDNAHIRQNASIGRHCIIGEKSYVAYDVIIGDYVKINSFVYIPAGVTIESKVMISAGCVFTNDKFPRAFDYRSGKLGDSAPNEETLETVVREGATVGAAATLLGGLEIGRFSMVGAGSVVTKSVRAHALVIGNPARQVGWVCVCGPRLQKKGRRFVCPRCRQEYTLKKSVLSPG